MDTENMSLLVQQEKIPVDEERSNDVINMSNVNSLHSDKKKFLIGLSIVFLIAATWVGNTQLGKETYTSHFNAPYFTIWFSTNWMMLSYPVCIPVYMLVYRKDLTTMWRHSTLVFSARGITIRSLATSTLPFTVLWEATNYMYLRALGSISPTDVTALFSSAPAFVYILSFLVLNEPLLVLRVFSVVLAISGITLFAYSDGFGSASVIGVSLAVLSAVGAATYKVCLKKRVGDADLIQMSLFLSLLGLFNFLAFWPIVAILHLTEVERLNIHYIPWVPLCLSALCSFAFNFFINFGIAFTFPLFISIGTILGIPINALIDVAFRHIDLLNWKITAATLIIGGFLLMLTPSTDSLYLQKNFVMLVKVLAKRFKANSHHGEMLK